MARSNHTRSQSPTDVVMHLTRSRVAALLTHARLFVMLVRSYSIWSWADMIENLPLIGRVYRRAQPLIGRLFTFAINKVYAWRAGVPLRSAGMPTNTIHAVYHPIESQRCAKEAMGMEEDATQAGKKLTPPMRGEQKGAGRKGADERKDL
jgi:hypothetical protein